jgi:hypothetical protein
MNVFGSSAVEETKKIVTNLEITNKNLETKLNMINLMVNDQKNRIKTLEEIIKTMCSKN